VLLLVLEGDEARRGLHVERAPARGATAT
jgi:hypothetical protein